ncbi:DUF6994 family protein [Agromyces allii]|uniref:Uncharacterized protein n=1 Tax=Agromyces allii TaxID=393607 RepID=A0ABP5BCV6_9MICO|nr:hypothetical protein [Agromyces allii]
MIDTTFDFRNDASGKDPDKYSPTLRRYHRALWSKPLPNGRVFDLDDSTQGAYLHHKSDLGEFVLASDSCIPTFTTWVTMRHILEQIPAEEVLAFRRAAYTIGGMMVFPGNKVDGRQTLNGARGFTRKIADRLDLTLECIRRYYLDEPSPLAAVLARYEDFFELFEDFTGYVDFFLLQDLVSADGSGVRFLMRFDDFSGRSVPGALDEYVAYRSATLEFIEARNRRIAALGL